MFQGGPKVFHGVPEGLRDVQGSLRVVSRRLRVPETTGGLIGALGSCMGVPQDLIRAHSRA